MPQSKIEELTSVIDALAQKKERKRRARTHRPKPPVTDPSISLRGRRHGTCNNEQCQSSDASYYSLDKHAWYCRECARIANREAKSRLATAVGMIKKFGRVCLDSATFDQHFTEQNDPRFDPFHKPTVLEEPET